MKTVIIVLMDHFADWEPAFVSSALTSELAEGYQVFYAANTKEPVSSIGGLSVLPQLTLDEVPRTAEAVLFIGADGSWHEPQEKAAALAREMKEKGAVIGGICDAARFLACQGLLNDVKHTLNFREDAKDCPAYTNAAGFVQEEAVRDGKVVTANGNAPLRFAEEVCRALGAASEERIQEYHDFYTLGLYESLKKYGYIKE